MPTESTKSKVEMSWDIFWPVRLLGSIRWLEIMLGHSLVNVTLKMPKSSIDTVVYCVRSMLRDTMRYVWYQATTNIWDKVTSYATADATWKTSTEVDANITVITTVKAGSKASVKFTSITDSDATLDSAAKT